MRVAYINAFMQTAHAVAAQGGACIATNGTISAIECLASERCDSYNCSSLTSTTS